MELRDLLKSNASYREFTEREIDDAELYDILDAARFAPSGGNRQGWKLVVLKDPAIRTAIKDLYVLSWREYMAHVTAGLVPFAPLEDGRWTGPAIDLDVARSVPQVNGFADSLDRAPVLLLVLADLTKLAVLDNGLDRQSIVGGGSIYPFCHNILLAARERGFGGVMTTALCRQEEAVRDLIGFPIDHAIASLIVLGEPARVVHRLKRLSVEEFSVIDGYDGERFTLLG